MSTASNVSQVVLQAKQDALRQGIATELGRMGKGEITGEEFARRRTALENAYNSWYASFVVNQGATPEETTQIREAYASQQAQVTEAKASQLLTDVVEGKISDEEYKREITLLEVGHKQRVGQILGGTYDVFHYGPPLAYTYSFSKPSAPATARGVDREPTEAEIDAYGESEAVRLTEEKGYQVGYDPESNQLFWTQQETEEQLDTRGYAEAVKLSRERGAPVRYDPESNQLLLEPTEKEIDIFGFSEAERLTREGDAKYEYDPDLNQLFRYETEKELDIRGFAEAERLTKEKGIDVTYDPELNKLFWMEEPPLLEAPERFRGPKEGSIGYELQKFVHSTFGPMIGPPLEAWGKFLGGVSKPALEYGAVMREQALEKAVEGKPWEGFALYASGVTSHGVGSVIGGATMIIDPMTQIKGLQSIASLVAPSRRTALVEHIATDPLTFSVGLGAGMLGGYTAGKLISAGVGKISKYRTEKFLRETPADDFLPYEQQYKYPQEITVLEDRWTMFKEKVNVVDDFGFPSQHMAKQQPGYRLSIPKNIDVDDVSIDDVFTPKQVSTASESAVKASDRITNPYLLIEDAIKKGYRRTGADLFQDLIPEGMGYTETWLRPTVIKAIPQSKFLSGISTSSLALFSVSSPSNLGLLTATIGAASVLSTSLPSLKTETVTKQATRLDQDLGVSTMKRLKVISYVDSVDISIPGLRMDVEPLNILKEDAKLVPLTVSIPNIVGKQKTKLDVTQKSIDLQVQTLKNILKIEPTQRQKATDIFPTGFGITQSGHGRDPLRMPDLFRETRQKKRAREDPFGWERREYGMRDINTLFGEKRSRKKKGKRKKKDDVLGGIVF